MLRKLSQTIFLLLVFLPGIFGKLYGQNNQYANIALPSAASMGLVSAVNHTTGGVNVSVPLHTVSYFGIQVPIGLSYNTSGIRVTDLPTEGGYGWRLTAGGKITRVVRQRPDDLVNIWSVWGKTPLQVAKAFFQAVDGTKYENYNEVDAEPDLFYYEIPGKSGMFVLDGRGKPYTIPYQPDLMVALVNGAYFTIWDKKGVLYTFGYSAPSRETTTVTFKNDNLKANDQTETQTYVSTWHLDAIQDNAGNSITLEYGAGQLETTTSTIHTATYWNNKPNLLVSDSWEKVLSQKNEVTTSTVPSHLSRITTGPNTVNFSWIAGRISEMSCSGNGSNFKQFYFGYDFLSSSNRVFLSQITTAAGTLREPLCSFEYNQSRLLPPHNSYDYDSWGYYNGKNNTTHIPVATPGDIREMSVTIPGADKSPVLEYAEACMLKAIIYNTGGRTEYTYGLNKHNSTDIGGLRVEKITHRDEHDREVSSVRYQYANSALGGLGKMPEHFSVMGVYPYRGYAGSFTAYSQPIYDLNFTSGSHIMYGKITEIARDGSKVQYEYSIPDQNINSPYANLLSTFWVYDNISGAVREGRGAAPFTMPQTSRFWRHGLLLKTTKYDPRGNNVEETSYTYKHDHPKQMIINGYAPYKLQNGDTNSHYLATYRWESRPMLLASTTTTSTMAPTVTTEYIYDNSEWVALKSIVQSTLNNTIQTTYRYAHDLTHPTGGDFPTWMLTIADILSPVEVITYNTDGKIIGAELTEYAHVPSSPDRFCILPGKKYSLPLQLPIDRIAAVHCDESGNLVYHSGYKLSQTLDYDRYGRLQTLRDPEGRSTHFLYAPPGANGQIVDEKIAEVSNASPNSFFYEGFEYLSGSGVITTATAKTGRRVYAGSSFSFTGILPGNYRLTYWKSTDSGRTWHKQSSRVTFPGAVISNDGWIDEVRVHPADAWIKTRTYLPGMGISSETDHNGVTTYWEYDPFGRVKKILDTDRQVVEEYEYHLKNQ